MQTLVIVFLILQVVSHSTTSFRVTGVTTTHVQSTCGRRLVQNEAPITNASPTKAGDWPWTAAIYHKSPTGTSNYKCAGTLLNSITVLTATHCIYENYRRIAAQRLTIQLGKHLFHFDRNAQEFQVREVIPHPDFDETSLANNIAIIRLSTDATLNTYVQPICLWDSSRTDFSEIVNKLGVVSGWGVAGTVQLAQNLNQVVIPVVPFITCLISNRDIFGVHLSDKNFCAGFRNGSIPCIGFGGGPMVFEEDGVYYIRGIASLSPMNVDGSCSFDYTIFTDVAQYLPWIEEIVPELKYTDVLVSTTTMATIDPDIDVRMDARIIVRGSIIYKGCYRDTSENHAYENFNLPAGNNVVRCADNCYHRNFTFSATSYGRDCYCGNSMPDLQSHPQLPEYDCRMTCPANRNSKCGGRKAISIYTTGL